jgi:hypothetical protein
MSKNTAGASASHSEVIVTARTSYKTLDNTVAAYTSSNNAVKAGAAVMSFFVSS